MNAWVLRQLLHPTGPDQFTEALAVVERMGDTLEFIERSQEHAPKNTSLHTAIRNALVEYREGPQ